MATIRQIHTLNTTPGNWIVLAAIIVFSGKCYFEETLASRLCKGVSKIFPFHSTYFSMGNYKVNAELMIGDGDDDDDNDDDDVSLAC